MEYQEIEQGIISRLRAGVKELRQAEPYEGQLEEEIEKLAVRLPSAFVVHGGSEFTWVDGSSYTESADVSVLIAVRSRSGRQVIEDTFEALAGLLPAEGAERLMPQRAGIVFTNRLISVHALEFRTAFDRTFKTETQEG